MMSRRFILSVLGLAALTYIGVSSAGGPIAVAWPIAAICVGHAAANAYEAKLKP